METEVTAGAEIMEKEITAEKGTEEEKNNCMKV